MAAASSSTTPSPHSADAILLLTYSPSCQYNLTSSTFTAWYARRRAASISARTSSNFRAGSSVVDRRLAAPTSCFPALDDFLRGFVTGHTSIVS
jgi:hypothetical protein